MEHVLLLLGDAKDPRVGGADTFTDRLNCVHTVFVLGFFAVVVSGAQWVGGSPISCWCPPHFTGTHRDYTNKVSTGQC